MILSSFSPEFNALMKREFCRECTEFSSVASLRYFIEQEYTKAQSYMQPDSKVGSAEELKLLRMEKAYSMFMDEYTALLDSKQT